MKTYSMAEQAVEIFAIMPRNCRKAGAPFLLRHAALALSHKFIVILEDFYNHFISKQF